jgi:hypothetical protein
VIEIERAVGVDDETASVLELGRTMNRTLLANPDCLERNHTNPKRERGQQWYFARPRSRFGLVSGLARSVMNSVLKRTIASSATSPLLACVTLCVAGQTRAHDIVDTVAAVRDHGVVLVGDSGTQCVMQNLNVDYRAWIDDCAEAGLNAIHIWSFVAPRQTRDGKTVEGRYGYVYPGVTPWARRSSGAPARDGLPQWSLREFDEGDDPAQHYWPRLRDLCGYAKQKNLVVGITVFFGWPKHQSDWAYHPFNVANGGHLSDSRAITEAVQQIAMPGTEVLDKPWSEAWTEAEKTQWLWERFAEKLLRETLPLGNTFYVFMDERSYSEGNCGDHFANFFRRRGAFWIDGQLRREEVDGVIGGHGPGRDINRSASRSFAKRPKRPFVEMELPPYQGEAVRHNLYACLLGGGHFLFHNDERQETVTTGIMSYDPNVKNSRREAVRERLRWLGIACRVMNERVRRPRELRPSNEMLQHGDAYCLAAAGSEFIVYIKSGGKATLQLDRPVNTFHVTGIDPRNGDPVDVRMSARGNTLSLILPSESDWIVLIQAREEVGQDNNGT